MHFPAMEFKQPLSTPPKLSLFSLPSKPPTLPPDGLTPPLNVAAAIPFLWEEAPGKPRLTTSDDPPKSKTVRSLDLPPRLTTFSPNFENNHNRKSGNNVGIEIIPSPTTVLGGPYVGVCRSNFPVESSEVVAGGNNSSTKTKGKMRMPLKKLMRKERSPVKFQSWRWEGLKEDVGGGGDGGERSPSARFCSWRWDSFRDMGDDGGGGGFDYSLDKMEKVARKNVFGLGSDTPSRFLANMYGTIKQAMPWRPRR